MALDTTSDQITAAPAPVASTGTADDVVHIVGWWQWFLDMVLKLKVPRALCGESLEGDPDRPDPMELGAPWCARCVELDGATPDDIERFNRERRTR
jgi:hypothetical protein